MESDIKEKTNLLIGIFFKLAVNIWIYSVQSIFNLKACLKFCPQKFKAISIGYLPFYFSVKDKEKYFKGILFSPVAMGFKCLMI